MSLLAAAADGDRIPDTLRDAPHVVATVIPVLTAEPPSAAHSLGLQLCAHVWLLTEELLRDAVGDDTLDVWAWLGHQPFISRGPDGLYAHDLVRDLLEAHLASRDPRTRRQLHDLVRRHARRTLGLASGAERLRAATQLLWLHRAGTPIGSLYAQVLEHGSISINVGRPSDHGEIVEHVTRWEGADEARIVSDWLGMRPDGLRVARRDPTLTGYCFATTLSARPGKVLDGIDDDTAERVLSETERLGPLRPGEQILLMRSAGGPGFQRDADCAVISGITMITDWLTSRFAWAWCVIAEPEVLGLPFSTYRRRLARGIEHVADLLWSIEVSELTFGESRQAPWA